MALLHKAITEAQAGAGYQGVAVIPMERLYSVRTAHPGRRYTVKVSCRVLGATALKQLLSGVIETPEALQ
jgi:hypothetical protein